MSQTEFKKRLKTLMNKPENQICSDCPERQPRWASLIVPPPGSPPGSLPIGAFCCLECSGSHRRLGVHISFVRSITLDSWKEKEVLAMENGGNKKVNAIFEASLASSSSRKPTTAADGPTRERFIRDKYERRKFYDPSVLQNWTNEPIEAEEEEEAPVRRKKTSVSRAPSEAARLRAESRMGLSTAAPAPATTPPAPPPPAAEVDLLDFAAFDSQPVPVAAPPAAAPTSPNLDLFADMTVNNAAPALNPQQPARKTNDQILAMFSAPSHQPTTGIAMATPNGGMMMAAATTTTPNMTGMIQQQPLPMMNNANNSNMMMMQGGFGMPQQTFGMQQQQQQANTMFMQQQGAAMFIQQQGNNTLMVQKNNQGNVMMMQQQQQQHPMMMMTTPQQQQTTNDAMMQRMQQNYNSDGFGFPQDAMGSGPPIPQNGNQFYNAYTKTDSSSSNNNNNVPPNQDPFAQFGTNVFR